jgi:hypothetical protein
MSRCQALIRSVAFAVLAPLLLLHAAGAYALSGCLEARPACCCARKSHEPVSDAATIQGCCCPADHPTATPAPTARVERNELSQPRAPLAAALLPRFDLARTQGIVWCQRLRAGADPPSGPPLILLKQSFLI